VGGLRAQLQNRESTSDAVLVGRWLECRAPSSARIAYDYFSYVPPAFRDASPTWGGSRAWLSALNPDIVIVNSVTAGAVIAESDPAEYYACLDAGRCGYERVLSRGVITVYGRSGRTDAPFRSVPPGATAECDAALLPDRP